MLDKIIHFSIQNKLIIVLFTLGLILWGIYSIRQLPIDAVPDITNNQVQVITLSPSLAVQEVEQLITFPVEQTMATIPELLEVRSISRFGLSVVTIVFHDDTDIYWARQQVNEKLREAEKNIPQGIGIPEIAPVSTGLGEIYQYVLHPEKGYEKKYTSSDLRTIQDWLVRRQLLGTPGIAEVNSFGGLLKQYEIALDPDKLRSANLSINDVFTALENNNQNTGGAYIDKKPNAYFIRSEGLISGVEDINQIVVKNTEQGIPILIHNIATVQIGNSIRYGALTRTTRELSGEAVGGIVMMLKGENSNQVVTRIKQKMTQIRASLPEGVTIEPFLDRSDFVGRAIGTVEKNLIEGALIVIFVLVLFLGNLRAGLIVASVIPLSMLFAISLMNLFGVSGNLMSLGAIDFGLIVDGAVIIVEATLHHIVSRNFTHRLSQQELDRQVYQATVNIRSSAAFGEIIILMVYLPLWALVGIEGKMFRPMAQTVSFAILGAFILSLTYVPMITAAFLSKEVSHKPTFSDRMMQAIGRLYTPIIRRALRNRIIIIACSTLLLILSIFIFSRLGGEFIPTLEEGDFAVETRLLTGSSLSQTIDKVQLASETLIKKYPQIKEIVGKIGSSEIPIDPMPMEACDLTILLKDKSEWPVSYSREELQNKMAETLEGIPGVSFGFSQPIQLRFNELISGVRQDVGIKIFGEDLNELTLLSEKIGRVVSKTEGAKDLYLEKVTGLPQIVISIDREQVAKHGLSISTINKTINAGFAGQTAGLVFEGEKRFDLVVRLSRERRQSIEDVRGIFVTAPNGNQIPLENLASVSFRQGPNQIQREDAKRRIIVGFNVRGRDIASVVNEIQASIAKQVKMPPGYYITYGGQFENLKEASSRLSIAVPVALGLILLLLYFTFRSVRQSLLIFTAIPMAAIGGVFALLVRDMPFSISAGVGFIALFGVAVLNGIVLIAEFNRLRKEGISDLDQIVLEGTLIRLRPVLMTASVASLGFLPMALSSSAGAEVQKPLATVVIGGLISSTILTLIVLPVLYTLFERRKGTDIKPDYGDDNSSGINSTKHTILPLSILLFSLTCLPAFAQTNRLSLEKATQIALTANYRIRISSQEIEHQQEMKRAASELSKTSVSLLAGQYNSLYNDNNITISQTIPFPSYFTAQNKLSKSLVKGSQLRKSLTENEIIYQVGQVYYQLVYLHALNSLLIEQDTIYQGFYKSASLRYKTGESTLLEKTTVETGWNEVKNRIRQNQADLQIYRTHLQTLLNSDQPVDSEEQQIHKRNISIPVDSMEIDSIVSGVDSSAVMENPLLNYLRQQTDIAHRQKSVETAKALPEFTVGYFTQTLTGTYNVNGQDVFYGRSKHFTGFQVGISIPVWFIPHTSRVKAAKITASIAQSNFALNEANLHSQYRQSTQEYIKNRNSIQYYETSALPNADLILNQVRIAFRKGELNYTEYLVGLRNALMIKEQYLSSLNQYNQSILTLEYLIGTK